MSVFSGDSTSPAIGEECEVKVTLQELCSRIQGSNMFLFPLMTAPALCFVHGGVAAVD